MCKEEERRVPIFGVVGASMSLLTAAVTNLLRLFQIPLVRFIFRRIFLVVGLNLAKEGFFLLLLVKIILLNTPLLNIQLHISYDWTNILVSIPQIRSHTRRPAMSWLTKRNTTSCCAQFHPIASNRKPWLILLSTRSVGSRCLSSTLSAVMGSMGSTRSKTLLRNVRKTCVLSTKGKWRKVDS